MSELKTSYLAKMELAWYENLLTQMLEDKSHAAWTFLEERANGKPLTQKELSAILYEFVRLEIAQIQAMHVKESIEYLTREKNAVEAKLNALPFKQQVKEVDLMQTIAEFKYQIGGLKRVAAPLFLLFNILI